MLENYRLMERLGSEPEQGKSVFTICIPVAILTENPRTVTRTVEYIRAAQRDLRKPVDVIVWANAIHKEEEERSAVELAAALKFDALKTMLGRQAADGVRIYVALQVEQRDAEGVALMKLVRRNFMDAAALHARRRRFHSNIR